MSFRRLPIYGHLECWPWSFRMCFGVLAFWNAGMLGQTISSRLINLPFIWTGEAKEGRSVITLRVFLSKMRIFNYEGN